MGTVTLGDVVAGLEARAADAERLGASAPVAVVLRQVAAELASLAQGNGQASMSAAATPSPALLTVREAAARLGVAPRWLYRRADALPFTRRLGRKTLRFDPVALAAWEARRRG